MLYFVVVLSLISAVYSDYLKGKAVIQVPQIVLDVVKKATADCMSETQVGQDVVDNFFKIKISPDSGTKKFIYCVGRKINYNDEDGRLNDDFLALTAGNVHNDAAREVLEKCNVKKETKYDTTYETLDCFYKNSPVLPVP